MSHIIVVGAGQAGASLTAKLRSEGFEGQITLIGAEPVLPYQRPPLSKAYLMGEMPLERLFLRPETFYAEQGITLRLGRPVTHIDADTRTVHIGDETIAYDQLALTTGSEPRHLPASMGGDLDGIHVVRGLADVDAMAPSFQAGARVLIVGGGYIGLEAASVAAKLGLQTTLIEMADRILQRVAAPETSGYFRALHGSHGVDIREGIGLERLLGDGHVERARLSDGSELDVDFVIAGVGITPSCSSAEACGIAVDNGISVDSLGRTSDPLIWAAGDCACFPYKGRRIRLESVQNAIDQAETVAENMLGAGKDYVPDPWFWSDQYDIKLQIAGLGTGYDRVVARAGAGPSVSYWYYKGDRLLAVDAMNDARNYMIGKRLIERGRSPAPDVIMDSATDMKALLKA